MFSQKERPESAAVQACREILHRQLFAQTAAMFRYCCNNGIDFPEPDFKTFDDVLKQWTMSTSHKPLPESGKIEKSDVVSDGSQENCDTSWETRLNDVVRIHNSLAGKVQPANPRAIQLIESEMLPVGWLRYLLEFRFMGPLIIVRLMMGVSIFMLILFLAISLFEEVNIDNLSLGLYGRLHGVDLAYNLIALLAAAGLGAGFAALFELRSYITKRTYDTVYATDYWIRFFLGLASGVILAELVPIGALVESESFVADLAAPVLAFLGGFSVQVVYRVLQRIVFTLETLVQGPPVPSETFQQVRAKEEGKKGVLKVRTEILSEIGKLQKVIGKPAPINKIKDEVDKLFDKVSAFDQVK